MSNGKTTKTVINRYVAGNPSEQTVVDDDEPGRPIPRFGEWFTGVYASDDNPTKHGMYVRTIRRRGRLNPGTFYELTDGKGDFWQYPVDGVVRREVDAVAEPITAYEAKCVRVALVWGDPALDDLPDDALERAKGKLRAIEFEAESARLREDTAFLGNPQHPDWSDYVATNLLDALTQVPDTGDWHGALRSWCERFKSGKLTPNRSEGSDA